MCCLIFGGCTFLEMPSGSCSATTPFKACKATCVGLDSAESAAEGDDDEATGADALSREFCFLRILRFSICSFMSLPLSA